MKRTLLVFLSAILMPLIANSADCDCEQHDADSSADFGSCTVAENSDNCSIEHKSSNNNNMTISSTVRDLLSELKSQNGFGSQIIVTDGRNSPDLYDRSRDLVPLYFTEAALSSEDSSIIEALDEMVEIYYRESDNVSSALFNTGCFRIETQSTGGVNFSFNLGQISIDSLSECPTID